MNNDIDDELIKTNPDVVRKEVLTLTAKRDEIKISPGIF
jgi:hypothetical protein